MPTTVVSSICDDRGEEPTYNGVTMSTLITGDFNVGDVISLLWFKRQLPKYATRFIEMCVMLCADHGPCVSGEARASGLLLFEGPVLRLPATSNRAARDLPFINQISSGYKESTAWLDSNPALVIPLQRWSGRAQMQSALLLTASFELGIPFAASLTCVSILACIPLKKARTSVSPQGPTTPS